MSTMSASSAPVCIRWWMIGLAFGLIAACGPERGSADEPNPIPAFLKTHCLACHQGEQPKGELRLDQLPQNFDDEAIRGHWSDILERVETGEMPPESRPRPADDALRTFASAVRARIRAAEVQDRAAEGRVVLRRLNRVEFELTVCELLGVDAELRELLALDSSQDGFDNVGSALHISSFAMERYLDAVDKALGMAITNRPQPPARVDRRYSLQETHQVRVTTEKVFRKEADGAVVMFCSSPWQSVGLTPFYPSERGHYRFRISASAVQSDGAPVVFRVLAGGGGMGGARPKLVGYFDAPAGEPAIIEFVERIEPRTSMSILPYGFPNAQTVSKIGAENYEGPGLRIDWVEVEGPLNDVWPPESHRRIFGDLLQAPAPIFQQRERVEVVSSDPPRDAEQILRPFLRRAFRRPVTDDDVARYLALFQQKLNDGRSFEQAIRICLSAILTSPDFLFLHETPGVLSDVALASRLSYFLWSRLPDEELLALAESNRLREPEVLHAQVERLLSDPRSQAFTENFVGQWLGLRDIDFTMPNHLLYPEFDDMLKASMVKETELFFAEVLKDDLPITNFLASDFSVLNGRLARHYGIEGVSGWEFRKVALPPESHRGGVLTMASVLKVTANGTTTSPVTRGAWVLERILGTPPPRPPDNIPGLEPDVRGATTIREQLAKHRDLAACASCHRQIDPPGFALESFDVIGGWREHYRTTGNGKAVEIDGRRMLYREGPPVDPADVLADGRAFKNIDELKAHLLADPDQFAQALAVKLITYATGAAPTATDSPQIEALIARVRERNNGFRTLIHELVDSEFFRSK